MKLFAHSSTPEAHAERPEPPSASIRIAAVQFDYQPSAILAYPFLEEPALLSEGEQGITSLRLPVPALQDNLSTLRKRISAEYSAFIRHRLHCILGRMNDLGVDLVVFPEYSIPDSCLTLIEEEAGCCTVVAGSHTVAPQSVDLCAAVGIDISQSDVGKSICPIRLADGSWQRVDKLTRSRWEGTMKVGTHWKVITMPTRSGSPVTFAVFLCVDFINDYDEHLTRLVDRDIWKNVHFGVVPSYSPTLRDFEQRARAVAERVGRPIVYANVGSVGGTRVYCHFEETTSLVDRAGTKPLAANDDAVVVVDLHVGGYAQFSQMPSPLPPPTPSRLVSVLPILSQSKYGRYSAIRQRIHANADDQQKRRLAQDAHSELMAIASESNTPVVLKTKLFNLLDGIAWRDGEWLDNCLDCIVTNDEFASLDEKRFTMLYEAQGVLANIIKDSRTRGPDIDSVSATLAVYRRALDTLRPRTSSAIVHQFEHADLAVHTIGDSKSPVFTSVFLMRVRSAQLHRAALDKQIKLISTLAYEGNKDLSLNIRFLSLPNPGGNLKHLEIQILGAARSEDLLDSRSVANTFRRDLANLLRVTLQDVYSFQLQELDSSDLVRSTSPFPFNQISELRRQVDFGKQPYIDSTSAPRIQHVHGSSTLARILDSLQSSPFACLVSVHLNPISLSESERAFYSTYIRAAHADAKPNEGALFFLGTERHPALRLGDALAVQKMLEAPVPTFPSLLVRLFVASDQPISKLLLNTLGNELWGDDSYRIVSYVTASEEHDAAAETLRSAWPSVKPAYENAPLELGRVPFLFDPYEASRLFRLPLEGYSGAVGKLSYSIPAPAAVLPDDGVEIGLGSHPGARQPLVVRLADEERTKHMYVIGKTGTGKSTLLRRMIEQDIQRNSGVCVIDPHGDLVDAVLERVPKSRAEDVVLLNPAATDRPFGLNLLEYNASIPNHKDFVVQETISIMRKLFYFEHSGPVFEHNIRHLVLTMLDESIQGNGTLIEVPRLLYDEPFRKAVTTKLKDPLARDFWTQYESMSAYHHSEQLGYIVSKFDTFTIDRIMRNIIGQSKSSISFSDVLQKKQILLIKLPSAMIGEINAALLGMIVLSKLRWAGMARAALPPGERTDYFIYVDEFQNFAASGFETILAEARKYKLSLVLAHQHIGQLSAFNIATGRTEDRAMQAIFGNAGTIVSFRVGMHDAKLLAEEFGQPVDPPDLENLNNYKAVVKTLINGEIYPPFTIQTTLGNIAGNREVAAAITQLSYLKYGRPKGEVEAEIESRRREIVDG